MKNTKIKFITVLFLLLFIVLPIFAQEFVYVSVEKAELKNSTKSFSEKVCNELRFLDMPHIEFLVDFSEVSLCENGIDSAEFLISANVGEAPKPITKIASGQEDSAAHFFVSL